MSKAFSGGRKAYSNMSAPSTEREVLSLLQRFIREEFRHSDVASDIADSDRLGISFAADGEQDAPMLFEAEGDLCVYGAFVYPATEHSVQTIWKNKFEMRETKDGDLIVNVSDWFGPTVDSWNSERQRY